MSTCPSLISATPEFYEYPTCDRDPLPYWSSGRVTLLGDAAHPMYPVGSNGASQAILDARCLADALARSEHPRQALMAYEQKRLPMTAEIVRSNRRGGPEGVIDAVEQLAPDGFTDIDQVLSYGQREAIVRGYASKAGFAARAGAGGGAGVSLAAHADVILRCAPLCASKDGPQARLLSSFEARRRRLGTSSDDGEAVTLA